MVGYLGDLQLPTTKPELNLPDVFTVAQLLKTANNAQLDSPCTFSSSLVACCSYWVQISRASAFFDLFCSFQLVFMIRLPAVNAAVTNETRRHTGNVLVITITYDNSADLGTPTYTYNVSECAALFS